MVEKRRIGIISAIVLSLITITSNCLAVDFKKDGYVIGIQWKQKFNTFEAWGDVEGGMKCKQLNLSVFFANSKDSGSAHVEAAIENYTPGSPMRFKASEKVYVDIRYRNKWHVDSIYAECLQ